MKKSPKIVNNISSPGNAGYALLVHNNTEQMPVLFKHCVPTKTQRACVKNQTFLIKNAAQKNACVFRMRFLKKRVTFFRKNAAFFEKKRTSVIPVLTVKPQYQIHVTGHKLRWKPMRVVSPNNRDFS